MGPDDHGHLDFSASNTHQFANNNKNNKGPVAVNYNVAGVTEALAQCKSLNSSLAAVAGKSLSNT